LLGPVGAESEAPIPDLLGLVFPDQQYHRVPFDDP